VRRIVSRACLADTIPCITLSASFLQWKHSVFSVWYKLKLYLLYYSDNFVLRRL